MRPKSGKSKKPLWQKSKVESSAFRLPPDPQILHIIIFNETAALACPTQTSSRQLAGTTAKAWNRPGGRGSEPCDVEQGKLGLDVPLTTYLPKPLVEGDERLAKITARIVLSHRTGFPNWPADDGSVSIYFTPGERFSYSGEGYIYLQRVVEKITGKPLNEYMTEAVFTPLGMTSSSYVWRPDFDALTGTGYDSDGKPDKLVKPTEALAASTLNTTAKDYALFVEAILNGNGLKPATLREMETPEIALDPECRICIKQEPKQLSKNLFWGLGWGIERKDGTDVLWHWGDNGSFKAFVMAEPKTKSGVVMFANSEKGLEVAKPVVDEVMGRGSLAFEWLK
jgi:CubicO group peptidase (beta-lactamase class C family)